MNPVLESLQYYRSVLIKEVNENQVARNRDGLNRALEILDNHIENEEIWAEVDKMSPEEVREFLNRYGEETK